MVRCVIVAWLLVAPAWCADADAPLSPPADHTVYSPGRRCYALLDARNKRTTIFQLTKGGSPTRLWDMAGWFRVASLSDDCEHLVAGFDGSNLLPLDFKRDLIMLSFYERGRLLRVVKLSELIRDITKLQRTVSHYYWGRYLGFGGPNQYLVETVEGERIAFDAATGQRMPAGTR